MPDSLTELAQQLDQFAKERDWQQFHSPKNLASALVVEACELLEHFQWMTEAQSRELTPEKRDAVGAEVSDVLRDRGVRIRSGVAHDDGTRSSPTLKAARSRIVPK